MNFTSITQRFVVWFLAVSLLPILLIGYSLLHTFEKEMQQTISRQIAFIADKKVDQIEGYLSELARDALIKTQGHTTRLAISEFPPVVARDGIESAAYRRLDASYRGYFKRFLNTTGYHDLLLISPQGTVVYSQKQEADFATNLYTGPYRNTGLAKIVRNALSTRESGISEFEIYAPSNNAIAAFIAVPIIIEGKLVGVLALQVDKTRVFQVLLDKTGLGDSGETVVARREDEHTAVVVTPLKSDPDASMKHKIPLDGHGRVMAMSRALNGERGSGIEMDYSGQSVVAAWRYLPRMGWGLVVKMDTAEALAPLYRVRTFALVVIGLALVAVLLSALLLGRRVTVPLRSLSDSTHSIAAGNLDRRVPVVGQDEMGQLADSFNTMAERLQSFYAELEGRVAQRTAELTRALAQEQETQGALRKERDFASTLVNTAPMIVLLLDTEGIIEYVNPYFEQLTGYRLDEVRGKEWFRTFLPARDQDKIRALFQNAVHDVPVRGNVNPIVTRSGEELEIEWHDQALRDTQGKVISLLAVGQDVTARRSMELALHISVERLNEAQLIAQLGNWELNLRTGTLIWSDEIFRLFEIDKSQFGAAYEAFLDAVHPDDRDRVNQAYAHSLETRTPYEITHRLRMSDGRIKWVHERCESDFDADGKPLRSLGTVQDITERKRSEVEYQTILKTTQDSFWMVDLQGRFLDVNDAYCELIGYSREELLRMTISDVEALESAEDTRAHIEKVMTTGADRFETRHRRKAGSLLDFEVSANFMAEGGGRMVVFLRDITERKRVEQALEKSESLFRTLAQVAPVGIFRTDASGASIYVNEQYCEIAGRDREEAMGTGWLAAVHPDDRALVFEAWNKAVKNRQPFLQELRLQQPAGKVVWIVCQARAEVDSHGEVVGYVGTVADISVRKQNEVALVEARQSAEAASRAKSEFLANMSHEIRTPMNAILGLTQLVLDTELTPRQQNFLQKAHTSALALLDVLNDVLDFSKIEAGRMGVEQVPFRLENTLEQVADLFSARIEEKGLELHFEVAPDTPSEILGDPLRLSQVLTNLVSNAVKFTEHGEIHVQIEVAERSPTTQQLRFTVRDTGIGLSKTQAEHLFQPFTQANGTTTRKYGGTGLGLAICKQLVELMGGEISASGVENQGSAFVFTIQTGVAPSPSTARPRAKVDTLSDPVAPQQDLQGMRVLLVEDNALNRLMAAEFLKRRGVALTVAHHGGEAVERVKGETFDAVLMDLHMPVMEGLEATRLIRELPQGKSLPIIAMTAAVLPEDRARCAAVGMVDFIAKPIDPEDMIRVLLKWGKTDRSKQAPFRVCCSASAEYNHGEDPCDLTFASSPRGERIEERAAPISTFPPKEEGAMVKGAGHDREGWGEGNASERGDSILPPSMPGFNLKAALHRLEGNRNLLARLLLDFVEEQSGTLAQLDALVQEGDSAQAAILLHTLVGVAANLGAETLTKAARQLEKEIKAGGQPNAMQGFADAFNTALDAIRTHVTAAVISTGSEPAIDQEALTRLLNHLVPYLQKRELIPVELIESLHDLAQADTPDKYFARLIRQIDHFDHDGALASVVQLAAIHGVTLGSNDP